jgi:hypothetical protein
VVQVAVELVEHQAVAQEYQTELLVQLILVAVAVVVYLMVLQELQEELVVQV